MRHYTEKNEYPILNSRYSTMHLKQYLDEKELAYLEKLLTKKNPKNRSEEELLKLWDKNIRLFDYTDRIKSNIKKITKVEILGETKKEVKARVHFTPKEMQYSTGKYSTEIKKYVCEGTFDKKKLAYTVAAIPGGLHLTYVDAEKIWDAVIKKAKELKNA